MMIKKFSVRAVAPTAYQYSSLRFFGTPKKAHGGGYVIEELFETHGQAQQYLVDRINRGYLRGGVRSSEEAERMISDLATKGVVEHERIRCRIGEEEFFPPVAVEFGGNFYEFEASSPLEEQTDGEYRYVYNYDQNEVRAYVIDPDNCAPVHVQRIYAPDLNADSTEEIGELFGELVRMRVLSALDEIMPNGDGWKDGELPALFKALDAQASHMLRRFASSRKIKAIEINHAAGTYTITSVNI